VPEDGLLDARALIALLEEATDRASHPADGSSNGFPALAVQLHARNVFQWTRESQVRDPTLSYARVAAIKREIDASNRERALLVESIDRLCVSRLRPDERSGGDGDYVNSETIGQLADRLSILTLKRVRTAARAEQAVGGERAECLDRVERITAQLGYVAECYDRFLAKLRAGSARMLVWGQFKLYDQSDLTNPEARRGRAQ